MADMPGRISFEERWGSDWGETLDLSTEKDQNNPYTWGLGHDISTMGDEEDPEGSFIPPKARAAQAQVDPKALSGGIGSDETAAARQQAAIKTARGVRAPGRGGAGTPKDLAPHPQSIEEYYAIPAGTEWVTPDDQLITKPYEPHSLDDYRRIPEGKTWMDPDGEVRTKPKYGDIGMAAQTWYHMAQTPAEKRKVLEKFYPRRVFEEPGTGDLYVEDEEGTQLKPRGFMKNPISFLAGGAVPTAGAVAGEVAGAAGGSMIAPGVGTVAGGVGGATVGGAIGQGFNDILLKWAGFYDRDVAEELEGLGIAGISSGVGSLIGQGTGVGAAVLKQTGRKSPSELIGDLIGLDPEGLEMALAYKVKGGGLLPISMYAKEAPHLINMEEVYLRAFATQGPIEQDITKYAEQQGQQIINDLSKRLGLPPAEIEKLTGSLYSPTAAVPTEQTGTAFKTKAGEELQRINEKIIGITQRLEGTSTIDVWDAQAALQKAQAREQALQQRIAAMGKPSTPRERAALTRAENALRKTEAEISHQETQIRLSVGVRAQRAAEFKALEMEYANARAAATKWLDERYQEIRTYIDEAFKAGKVGRDTGQFYERVARQLQAVKRANGVEANRQYSQWENNYGNMPMPRSIEIGPEAESLMFYQQAAQEGAKSGLQDVGRPLAPGIVRLLAKLAPAYGEGGEIIKPAQALTLGELHDLRTLVRQEIWWEDLNSDVANGQKKAIQNKINNIMHDILNESPERFNPLRDAVTELDKIDAWYNHNIGIFNEKTLNAVVRGLEGGEPADPRMLYQIMIKEGRSDLNRRIHELIGDNMWTGIKGIDADEIMRLSQTEVPGVIDGMQFITQVLNRHRSGLLQQIHGDALAEDWVKLIRGMKLLNHLEGAKLKIPIQAGEKIPAVLEQLDAAIKAKKAFAEADPIKALAQEMKAAQQEKAQLGQRALPFLYDTNYGAEEAANEILKKPQNIAAAERIFGRDSPEFNMLRRTYVWSLLQNELDPSQRLAKISPEIQALMMPGVTLDQIQIFAKEMHTLLGTRALQETAKSMAAQNLVNNPITGLPIISGAIKAVPGVNAAARGVRTQWYKLIAKIASHPATLQFLARGMASRDPAVRAATARAIRADLRRFARGGGAAGAGFGEYQYQAGREDMVEPEEPESAGPGFLEQAGQSALDAMMGPTGMARSIQRNIQNLPGFAEGGVTPGGPVVVGEKGPEVVDLPAGSEVTPNPGTERLAQGITDVEEDIISFLKGGAHGVAKSHGVEMGETADKAAAFLQNPDVNVALGMVSPVGKGGRVPRYAPTEDELIKQWHEAGRSASAIPEGLSHRSYAALRKRADALQLGTPEERRTHLATNKYYRARMAQEKEGVLVEETPAGKIGRPATYTVAEDELVKQWDAAGRSSKAIPLELEHRSYGSLRKRADTLQLSSTPEERRANLATKKMEDHPRTSELIDKYADRVAAVETKLGQQPYREGSEPFSKEEITLFKDLLDEGLSVPQIQRDFLPHRSKDTLYYRVRQGNFEPSPDMGSIRKHTVGLDVEEVKQYIADGLSYSQIAEKMGTNRNTIASFIHANKLGRGASHNPAGRAGISEEEKEARAAMTHEPKGPSKPKLAAQAAAFEETPEDIRYRRSLGFEGMVPPTGGPSQEDENLTREQLVNALRALGLQ